ncbi:hypothetical protein HAZT_HAZT001096, partial [Hyalella azteca]
MSAVVDEREILKRVHDDGHLSLHKCRRRVESSVWWPNVAKDLTNFIERCVFCQIHRRKNHKEPIRASLLPERPWQKVGLDLFHLGNRTYLIIVDYFSRWFETVQLHHADSTAVVDGLKSVFAAYGIPEHIRSDGGPQFTSSSFRKFVGRYCITHTVSDPFRPQANGCAERAVQVAKRLLRTDDPFASLLAYRNTPLDVTGCSPAQLLMGRRTRSTLPVLSAELAPNWPDFSRVRDRDSTAKVKSEESFKRQHGARPLTELRDGQSVRIKLPGDKAWSDSTSVASRLGKNSYLVRNREFLQTVPDDVPATEEPREQTARGGECPVAPERGESAAVEPLPPAPAVAPAVAPQQNIPVACGTNLDGGDFMRKT